MKAKTHGLIVAMVAMIVGLLMPAAGWAVDPNAVGDNAQPGAAPQLTVKVLEVDGRVQHRPNPDADWQPLTADTQLSVGSEVRTGLRSMAQIQIGPNSVITLKGLGIVAIAELARDEQADVMHTRLAKKYGRLIAEVHQVGETRNDYKISTPGSVLAVRGSGIMHTGYDTEQMHGLSGNINYRNNRGQNHNYTGGDNGTGDNPNPTEFSETNSNLTNTSTPGTDHNQGSSNPNTGYFGSASGQMLSQMRDMMMQIDDIHRDNPGSGGNP
jgi:hypothetical protein